ncbi:imidazole glycerol phosphate synthase subunit HisH [Azospirillum sp. TSA2s]|uniref:imidazole glycerol phosphate synthase subunit HisH n=1 Tax=Azospirillum sp. TSA2s TaxID=709810 RepID=UPI00145B8860|nr:imidazole glycerol phosphate synthase subunit HisH [Azospirillum sp. TSA2s]
MIVVVDYGRGNLFSIDQALRHLGCSPVATSDPAEIEAATGVILPGVGAFGDAMDRLRQQTLIGPLQQTARSGRPFLGICLGMQMLASHSEEFGTHEGLDLVPGHIRRLPEDDRPGGIEVPNIGWRRLIPGSGPTAEKSEDYAYFVHSYFFEPTDPSVISSSINFNGHMVPAIIRSGNIQGFQFHPERSGPAGLRFLENFLRCCSNPPG